jgi:hypothetical protein
MSCGKLQQPHEDDLDLRLGHHGAESRTELLAQQRPSPGPAAVRVAGTTGWVVPRRAPSGSPTRPPECPTPTLRSSCPSTGTRGILRPPPTRTAPASGPPRRSPCNPEIRPLGRTGRRSHPGCQRRHALPDARPRRAVGCEDPVPGLLHGTTKEPARPADRKPRRAGRTNGPVR